MSNRIRLLAKTGSMVLSFALAWAAACSVHAGSAANCDAFNIDAKSSTPLAQVGPGQPGACKVQIKNGYPVPDPACTPGAINETLTADVLRNPEFRTSCVRDNATTPAQKASTYAWYQIPHPENNRGVMQTCELDHLISLELGGADSLENIWPQCGPANVVLRERYFKQKDAVENYLAKQVHEGLMALKDAQEGIAKDWTQYLEAVTGHAQVAGADTLIDHTSAQPSASNAPSSAVVPAVGNPNDTDYAVPTDHPWGQATKSSGCHSADGLPDAACTPGDILPEEDEAVVCSADFRTGSVRDQTTSRTQKRAVYPAYGTPYPQNNRGATQVCEIDHLVALQLGGADTIANLWPECSEGYANWQGPGFRDKDGFENYLWFHVCKKQDLSLRDAQLQIASDWRKYWEQAGKPECRNRNNCK